LSLKIGKFFGLVIVFFEKTENINRNVKEFKNYAIDNFKNIFLSFCKFKINSFIQSFQGNTFFANFEKLKII